MLTETDIKGYEGRYRIDIYGNVWRLYKTKKSRMKPTLKPRGHLEIRLSDDKGQRKQYNLARLVAIHFIPNSCLSDSVVHKNGDKTDAFVDNLKWLSKRQTGFKYGGKVKKAKRVCKIDQSGEVVEIYHSVRLAAKANYMSYQTISDRCNGKVKGRFAPDGYEYRYAGEDL